MAQEASLQALQLAAMLCMDTLHECHASTPQALTDAATMLHDHALLVRQPVAGAVRRSSC